MDILHPRSGFSTSSKMIWYSHTHTVQFKPAQFKAVSTPSGKLSSNNPLLLIFIQSLKMRRKLVTCVPCCLSECYLGTVSELVSVPLARLFSPVKEVHRAFTPSTPSTPSPFEHRQSQAPQQYGSSETQ